MSCQPVDNLSDIDDQQLNQFVMCHTNPCSTSRSTDCHKALAGLSFPLSVWPQGKESPHHRHYRHYRVAVSPFFSAVFARAGSVNNFSMTLVPGMIGDPACGDWDSTV